MLKNTLRIAAFVSLACLASALVVPAARAETIPGTAANMNQNPFVVNGWTATSSYWSWGTPYVVYGEPSQPYTGTHLVGYKIGGNYTMMGAEYLRTGALNCSEYQQVHLQFWRWLWVENSSWDKAMIQVSSNGLIGPWTTIWSNSPSVSHFDTQWTFCSYDVSNYADGRSDFRVRWQMGPVEDYINNYTGWYIDDFSLVGVKAEWIALSTTSLSVTTLLGSDPVVSPTFEVWSGAASSLSFAITSNTTGWPAGTNITFTPSSGTSTGVNDKKLITVNCATADFPAVGTYTASIIVRNTATNATKTIPLTVHVKTPGIAATPLSIRHYSRRGFDSATSDSVSVWNSGAGTLEFGADVEYTSDWGSGGITLTPEDGSSTGPEDVATIEVEYQSATLPEGEHTAVITLSDNGSSPPAQEDVEIAVTLVVTVPEIAASTGAVVAQCLTGNAVSAKTFKIWNSGDGEMIYTIANDAWFECENSEGEATGSMFSGEEMTLSVAFPGASGLVAGKHEGSITISDPAADEDKTVAVTLYVGADTDGDGLVDLFESDYLGTDPGLQDSNGDGLTDGYKYFNDLDPLGWDTDGDGFSDAEEIAAGTNPRSASNHPLMAFSGKGGCSSTGLGGAAAAVLLAAFALGLIRREGNR